MCSFCGDPKLTLNQSLALKLEEPGFSVSHTKYIMLHPNLVTSSFRQISAINTQMKSGLLNKQSFPKFNKRNSTLIPSNEIVQSSPSVLNDSSSDSE